MLPHILYYHFTNASLSIVKQLRFENVFKLAILGRCGRVWEAPVSSTLNLNFFIRVFFCFSANQVPFPTAISNVHLGWRVDSSILKAVPILVLVFIKSARLSRNDFFSLATPPTDDRAECSRLLHWSDILETRNFLAKFSFFSPSIHISKVFRLPLLRCFR